MARVHERASIHPGQRNTAGAGLNNGIRSNQRVLQSQYSIHRENTKQIIQQP